MQGALDSAHKHSEFANSNSLTRAQSLLPLILSIAHSSSTIIFFPFTSDATLPVTQHHISTDKMDPSKINTELCPVYAPFFGAMVSCDLGRR